MLLFVTILLQIHKDEIKNATVYHAGTDSNIIHPVDYTNDIEATWDDVCEGRR